MQRASFPARLLLAAAILLQGCAGGPRDASTALEKLNRGDCPETIVRISGQPAAVDARYGAASGVQLLRYRELELENCRRATRRGDAAAMRTLASFWKSEQDFRREASSYLTYLEYGEDRKARGEANAALFRLYTKGGPGLPADERRAFEHLSQAVTLGVEELRLTYANALFERKLYSEARRYYVEFASADAGEKKRIDACEANLRLADIHFRGLGEEENWFLGYYFWQRGMALADGGRWGSCYHDNFVFGDRYYQEKERKGLAESRSATLSAHEIRDLQSALEMDWAEGLSRVEAMRFSTRGRPTPVLSRPEVAYAISSGGWPGWAPLRESLCELSASVRTLSWADLFELRSGNIWTVLSSDGQRTTRGSAVAVAPRQLLSNCHLIHRPDQVELQQGKLHLSARVSAADLPGDRCILATSELLPTFVRSAQAYGALRIGAEVAAIGNPRGLDTSLSRGIIAQKRRNQSVALIQTDTTLATGSSGGGLFDQAGNLIGITTFRVGQGADLNFAIAVDEFCR